MHYSYNTKGTCSRNIQFDIDDKGVVTNVSFYGGCPGNLKALSILVDGMTADEIEKKLNGVRCGMKDTSCSDQLAHAVREAYEKMQ